MVFTGLLLGLAIMQTACGKKGPLYLPAEADAPKASAPAPAPVAPVAPGKEAGAAEGARQK